MDRQILDEIIKLRQMLHECPELSGQERKTKKLLMDFLRQHTGLELHLCGNGFYAAYRGGDDKKMSVALRADYDALALPEGGAAHLCGHDGHSAVLCGVALLLEKYGAERRVFLLFQPAEETGEGAEGCMELLNKEKVDEIYGAHNLPGIELGQVTTRPGTFACASQGLTIILKGKATHAAYPENGRSPAEAVGRFLCELPSISAPELYEGMVLCTVIGVQMGEKAFGAAAADARIWLTLRGEHDYDLKLLYEKVVGCARRLAGEYGLEFQSGRQDVFPSTENDRECAEKVLKICSGTRLKTPMRWSEDFGHYLKQCKGAYIGIGSGISHAALHTEYYEYPDELLEPSVEMFWKLILGTER